MVVEPTAGFKGRLSVSKYLLHSGVSMLDIPLQKSILCITYFLSTQSISKCYYYYSGLTIKIWRASVCEQSMEADLNFVQFMEGGDVVTHFTEE